MQSTTNQIKAVVNMNLLSLPHRLWMSLATIIAVAIVVGVLLAFLAMSVGFQKTVGNTGSSSVAVMLREGAKAEINSSLSREQLNLISSAPGIVEGLVSGELYLIVDGMKKSSQTEVNLPLRGIDSTGMELRDNFNIVEGRMFETGKNELVVGAAVSRQFSGFELGAKIRLKNVQWEVVGIFSAAGSVFESEIWADTRVVQSQFNRGSSFQVFRVKLQEAGNLAALQEYIKNDSKLNLELKTEQDYYSEQSQGISNLIFYVGWPLAILMAIGALAGALNTMYTSVSQRAVEIATLRALGFGGTSAFFGTLIESLVLAIIGGLLGTSCAYILFDGLSASTVGESFTQIVFDFRITADSFIDGFVLALIIGLVGGVFPAWKAARVPVATAFASGH